MLVSNYLDKNVFDYIDPRSETLAYIACSIRASYHLTIMATPCQAILGRYMLFNLASVVYWRVVTPTERRQIDIDNVPIKARQVTHDYAVGNVVYVEINGIYHKLDYKKQSSNRIIEVFKNSTV